MSRSATSGRVVGDHGVPAELPCRIPRRGRGSMSTGCSLRSRATSPIDHADERLVGALHDAGVVEVAVPDPRARTSSRSRDGTSGGKPRRAAGRCAPSPPAGAVPPAPNRTPRTRRGRCRRNRPRTSSAGAANGTRPCRSCWPRTRSAPKMRLTHRSALVSAAARSETFIGLRPSPVLAAAKNATSYLVLRLGTACSTRPRRRRILCRPRNSDHEACVEGSVRER